MGRAGVFVAVLAVATVGCSGGTEPAEEPTTSSASSEPTTTDTVALELPVASVGATLQVPASAGPDAEVIAADAEGLWVMHPSAVGWVVDRTDPSGAIVSRIDLPGSAYRPEVRASVGGSVWVPGRTGDDPSVPTFGLVRIDFTGGARVFPTPAFVDELQADGETVWAIMEEGDDAVSVGGYDAFGALGEPTVVPKTTDDSLSSLFTVTSTATYDCLRGDFGVTPHGGTRRELGQLGRACNTTPVGGDVIVSDGEGGLLVLSASGEPAPVHLESGVTLDVCDGSRQSDASPLLVCRSDADETSPGAGVVIVSLELGTPEFGGVEALLGIEPPIGFSELSTPEARRPGDAVGVIGEQRDLATVRSVVIEQLTDGSIAWRLVDPAVVDDELVWFGTQLWARSLDGKWSQIFLR